VFCNIHRVVDKRERDGNKDESDVDDPCGNETSVVRLACLGWEDVLSV